MIAISGFAKAFPTHAFMKPRPATVDVSFEVAEGEVFGFLGPNGSGKTTTIKALLGLVRPDKGTLMIAGHPAASLGWRGLVGYLPENPNFYEYLSARELVTWFGCLAGSSRHEAEVEAKKQLERVGLSHAMERPLRTYSKGMLQRAGLAQALMGSPKLLILDEPMTGLDPMGRKDVRDLILALRAEGRTILYSTHILSDVEVTADRVAILDKGRVLRTGKLSDFFTATARSVTVRFSGIDPERLPALEKRAQVTRRQEGGIELELANAEIAQEIVAQETARGARLEALIPHREDLETLFVRTLREHGATPETGASR